MTHVVTEACIKCKYTTCVQVCPVDCFREGKNMLVIDPDICIDCGVCIPECPIGAIVEDKDGVEWLEMNKTHAQKWPKIVVPRDPLENAELHKDESNKYEKYFHENEQE